MVQLLAAGISQLQKSLVGYFLDPNPAKQNFLEYFGVFVIVIMKMFSYSYA